MNHHTPPDHASPDDDATDWDDAASTGADPDATDREQAPNDAASDPDATDWADDAAPDPNATDWDSEALAPAPRDAPQTRPEPATLPPSRAPGTPRGSDAGDWDRFVPSEGSKESDGWTPGRVIAGLYEVRGLLGQGGMGTVHKVLHRQWAMELAVKAPRPELLASAKGRALFVREAETWVGLGVHPHVVSCYYVRTLKDGIPRVFIEFVDGGSLADAIRSGRVYQGASPREAVGRALDVAIQLAWGLHYAHRQGLVHQDVKPANAMMTPDGVVKVTDFGLAQATAGARGAGVALGTDGLGRALVPAAGGTPAYRPPEQSAGAPVSLAADVWAWAVSVLELWVGEVMWAAGAAAPYFMEAWLGEGAQGPVTMPPGLAALLRRCMATDPEARPVDLGEVVEALLGVYAQTVGAPYARRLPDEGRMLADGLNNRGVSLLDLGRPDAALELIQRALKADPHHLQAIYNRGLLAWRRGALTDVALLDALAEASGRDPGLAHMLRAWVHLERVDVPSMRRELELAARHSLTPRDPGIDLLRQTLPHQAPIQATSRQALEGERAQCAAMDRAAATALLSGGGDDAEVIGLGGGGRRRRLRGHTEPVSAVGLSAGGARAVTGDMGGQVRVWEVAPRRCTWHALASGRVEGCAVTPGGAWVASVDAQRVAMIWHEGRLAAQLRLSSGVPSCVALSDGAERVCVGGWDRSVRVWRRDGDALEALGVFSGHVERVRAVAVRADMDWVLSASDDGTARLWRLGAARCLRTFELPARPLAATLTERAARVLCEDGALLSWTLPQPSVEAPAMVVRPSSSEAVLERQQQHSAHVAALKAAQAQGRWSDAIRALGAIRALPGHARTPETRALWRALLHRCPRGALDAAWSERLRLDTAGSLQALAVTPSGACAVVGAANGTAHVVRGSASVALRGHVGAVFDVGVSSDGAVVVTAGEDATVRVWDGASGACVRVMQGHGDQVNAVRVTACGRLIVSASDDRTARVWETQTGACLATLRGPERAVTVLDITPDGQLAAFRADDGAVLLWDLVRGRKARKLSVARAPLGALALAVSGAWCATGHTDGRVEVWDCASGKRAVVLDAHDSAVTAIVQTADGRHLATAGLDGSVAVWEREGGACVRRLEPHKAPVLALAWSADGASLLAGTEDAVVMRWELDWALKPEHPSDASAALEAAAELVLRAARLEPAGLAALNTPREALLRQLMEALRWRGWGRLAPEQVQRAFDAYEAGWSPPAPIKKPWYRFW